MLLVTLAKTRCKFSTRKLSPKVKAQNRNKKLHSDKEKTLVELSLCQFPPFFRGPLEEPFYLIWKTGPSSFPTLYAQKIWSDGHIMGCYCCNSENWTNKKGEGSSCWRRTFDTTLVVENFYGETASECLFGRFFYLFPTEKKVQLSLLWSKWSFFNCIYVSCHTLGYFPMQFL